MNILVNTQLKNSISLHTWWLVADIHDKVRDGAFSLNDDLLELVVAIEAEELHRVLCHSTVLRRNFIFFITILFLICCRTIKANTKLFLRKNICHEQKYLKSFKG